MTGRTHDLAAFAALSFVVTTQTLHTLTLSTALVAIASNLIGGITPDIDQPTAPFWRNLPIGGVIGRIFDPLLGGHRFLSHSIVGAALFGTGWFYILKILKPSFPHLNMEIIWWAFIIGYISHLVMDTITKEGVPWLLPIPIKFAIPPIKALRVTTGGFVEKYIVFGLLLLFIVYVYWTHYPFFLTLLRHLVK